MLIPVIIVLWLATGLWAYRIDTQLLHRIWPTLPLPRPLEDPLFLMVALGPLYLVAILLVHWKDIR